MKIKNIAQVAANHSPQQSWSMLRSFHNSNFTTELLCNRHGIPSHQRGNAEKQAEQIRYTLVQAKEYFDAASVATLATQPALLYYGAMSLALAEILSKQSGDSSLDRARQHHRHHGLDFGCLGKWSRNQSLTVSASRLNSRPAIRSQNQRFGTFELWHRSAREAPIGSLITEHFDSGTSSTGLRISLDASDSELPQLPLGGITLLECLSRIPGLESVCSNWGVRPQLVRASVGVVIRPTPTSPRREYTIMVHPGEQSLLEKFYNNWLFYPSAACRVEAQEPISGIAIRWWEDELNFPTMRQMPHGCNVNTKEVKFWAEDGPLNEFGYIYTALFIAGNYARYYPDWWLRDIEEVSPLALAIEQLIKVAIDQLPLLSLSELSGRAFIRTSV